MIENFHTLKKGETPMLRWSVTFFIIAIIAFVLGMDSVAVLSGGIGRLLLIVFLILSALSLIVGLFNGKTPNLPR